MDSKNYLDDISEIKQIMNRSSRFISLSGLSGILAGVYALIGAFFAWKVLNMPIKRYEITTIQLETIKIKLIAIAAAVIFLSIITAILLTVRKAKKENEKIWDISSKRLVVNFLIPLVSGGIFTIMLIQKEIYGFVAATTLIFYGLACINASKYTLSNVRYLGMSCVILGLLATQFQGYGLYFWVLGFGIFHIIYGSLLYIKHEK